MFWVVMDDYAALVERVCFVLPKVFGCLLLSEDGMVLSGFPDEGVNVAEAAWRHFCALDEPMRGFLAFGDQHWAYVRIGAYAVFVVADVSVRPGVMIDRLEQVLSTAAISREAGTFKLPEATASPTPITHPAPVSEPRAAPEPRAPEPVAPPPAIAPVAAAPASRPADPEPRKGDKKEAKRESKKADPMPVMDEPAPVAAPTLEPVAAAVPAPAAADTGASWAKAPGSDVLDDDEEEAEVDRIQLAQEFSGLLQMDGGFDEGSS